MRWNPTIKSKVRSLRKQGESYGEITARLGVPKSTIHCWVRDLGPSSHQTPEAHMERWKRFQQLGAHANKLKRQKEIQKIANHCKEEVSKYNLNDEGVLKTCLSLLYWAEGSKLPASAPVSFANTDPKLLLLFLTLLRSCYSIDESRLRVRLHLHYYHKVKKVKSFWSDLLDIPTTQFGKTYIKPRSKTKRFRKNFVGICVIRYNSCDLRHEIMQTAYAAQKKICN